MQRPQPAERQPRGVEVELPEVELGGDKDAGEHAHHGPHDGGDDELADNLVVEFKDDFAIGHVGNAGNGKPKNTSRLSADVQVVGVAPLARDATGLDRHGDARQTPVFFGQR